MNCPRLLLMTLVLLTALTSGCATIREVTITTQPPDATIAVDGEDVGQGTVTHRFSFASDAEVSQVTVSKPGWESQTVTLRRNYLSPTLEVDLDPETRRVRVEVGPVPASIRVGAQDASPGRVASFETELPFTIDATGQRETHRVVAARTGFVSAETIIRWDDPSPVYELTLEPMRKDLSVTTTPAGASIYLDDQLLGTSPLFEPQRPFPVNPDSDEFLVRTLTATKPGYDPVTVQISWDGGRSDYSIELLPKQKRVELSVTPADARVTIAGQRVPLDPEGKWSGAMRFPPINEETGELASYEVVVSRDADAQFIWEPQEFQLGWDDEKTDYVVALDEILEREVPETTVTPRRTREGWTLESEERTTLGYKNVDDGDDRPAATPVLQLEPGETIGSIAVSLDGRLLLFSQMGSPDPVTGDPRSVLRVVPTDGSAPPRDITDGKTLDLTPSFAIASEQGGDGEKVVFASNRSGARLDGHMTDLDARTVTRLSLGDLNAMWPTITLDRRKPIVFFEGLSDTHPEPKVFSAPLGSTLRTELTTGRRPRPSPRNDSLVFDRASDDADGTATSDVFLMPVAGGEPTNLSNTPDANEYDAAFSADGSMIAFVSDRQSDSQTPANANLWVVPVNDPDGAKQVTFNASIDDRPTFDPGGSAIYFRSNRGGTWGVWRISLD